jgi:hypothetical protein
MEILQNGDAGATATVYMEFWENGELGAFGNSVSGVLKQLILDGYLIIDA